MIDWFWIMKFRTIRRAAASSLQSEVSVEGFRHARILGKIVFFEPNQIWKMESCYYLLLSDFTCASSAALKLSSYNTDRRTSIVPLYLWLCMTRSSYLNLWCISVVGPIEIYKTIIMARSPKTNDGPEQGLLFENTCTIQQQLKLGKNRPSIAALHCDDENVSFGMAERKMPNGPQAPRRGLMRIQPAPCSVSYLMKNVGRSSAREWLDTFQGNWWPKHIHLPSPVYCPDVGGQLNHPPPKCAFAHGSNF